MTAITDGVFHAEGLYFDSEDLLCETDGSGDIGQTADKRPNDAHIKRDVNVGRNLAVTGTIIGSSTGKVATTFGVGGATPAASGSGVSFPAAQSASADANTLDDYEEGTFTPAITFGGGSTGLTYSNREGVYTKIGRMVHCVIWVQMSAKGSSTGGCLLTGLPFTTGHFGSSSVGYYANFTGAGYLHVLSNTSTSFAIRYAGATGGTLLDDTHFQNTSELIFSVTYYV